MDVVLKLCCSGLRSYILGMHIKHSKDRLCDNLVVTGQQESYLTELHLLTW